MKTLTWDEVADFYDKKTGGTARIQTISKVYKWATRQPEIVVNDDTSLSWKLEENWYGDDDDGRTGPYAYDNGYSAGYAVAWNEQQTRIDKMREAAKPAPEYDEQKATESAICCRCFAARPEGPCGGIFRYDKAYPVSTWICLKCINEIITAAKPAPETTSELGSIPLFSAKARSDYWYNDYEPATPAQVRAEFERMFPDEVKRGKVAEALRVAILDDNAIDDYDLAASHIQDFLDYLLEDDMSNAEFADIWFDMLKHVKAALCDKAEAEDETK
jgi:hypothetical protein